MCLFTWFENKFLKGNADKCHFVLSTRREVSLNIDKFKMKNGNCEKLDSNLIPNLSLINILQICTEELGEELARVMPFTNLSKRRLLTDTFSKTHFN